MADFLFYEAIDTILAICQDKRIFVTYPTL